MDKVIVGRKLQMLRNLIMVSQKDLAGWLGCAASSIPNYEAGKTEVPFSFMVKFREQGIDLDYFLALDNPIGFADIEKLRKAVTKSNT